MLIKLHGRETNGIESREDESDEFRAEQAATEKQGVNERIKVKRLRCTSLA